MCMFMRYPQGRERTHMHVMPVIFLLIPAILDGSSRL